MMASLLTPSSQQQQVPRISQLLPTVKCSSCNNPVPLAELGDHVCSTPPPVPQQPRQKSAPSLPRPTLTPAAATALLPTRLQNLVAAVPRTPSPASSTSSGGGGSGGVLHRGQSPRISTNSSSSPPRFPTSGPSRGATSPVESFRARTPSSNFNSSPTNPSPLATRPGSDFRVRTPSNNATPRPSLDSRARTPSDQSSRPNYDPRARTPSNNSAPLSLSPGRGPTPVFPPPRQGSYAAPRPPQTPEPFNVPPIAEPGAAPEFIDTKSGGEAGMAGVGRRGFAAAARAAMFTVNTHPLYGGPSGPPGGWNDGRGTPFRQNAPGYLNMQGAEFGNPHARAGAQLTPPSPHAFRSQSSTPQASQARTPSPGINPRQATTPVAIPNNMPTIPPLNTSLPTSSMSTSPTSNSSSAGPITPLGATRLPFFEKYKMGFTGSPAASNNNDILYDSDNRHLDKSAPDNTQSSAAPSPLNRSRSASTASNGLPSSPAASRSASSASSYSARTGATRQRSNTATTTTSTAHKHTPSIPVPKSPSGSEFGLAYADSADDDDSFSDGGLLPFPGTIGKDTPSSPPKVTTPAKPTKTSILRKGSPQNDRNHIRFPSMTSESSSQASTKTALLKIPNDKRARMSTNTNSVYSDSDDDIDERMLRDSPKSSKGLSLLGLGKLDSGGPLHRNGTELESVMENLMEDLAIGNDYENSEMKMRDPVVGRGGVPTRSNTVPGGMILPSSEGRDSVKLPPLPSTITRSRTTPSSGNSVLDLEHKSKSTVVKVKKARVCVKCKKQIEDGRWIAVDGNDGGVLCEGCWKHMYLPKCRRCERPIETAAISSSDGQLKGKYHKECFNCYTCQKPFPDKTFYVFDGRPYCRYHYHEVNESLCAAAVCGQPIEGPCAVSHSGDRYHPEHFLCEHPGYPCRTRLEEYWEVDGRMLCDRHARTARSTFDGDESDYGEDDEERDPVMTGRAMKRVTRFIDLGDSGLR